MTQAGLKYDQDKLRWDLLPIECVEDIVKVLTMGASKYSPNNWQSVDNAEERYYAAVLRHLSAWRQGEKVDPESQLSHLAHILCDVTFLLWFEKEKNKQLSGTTKSPVNTVLYTNVQPHVGTFTYVPSVGSVS
jgi:hypothetical protein